MNEIASRGPALRQDPLEASLVIFGRSSLIFFCSKALGNMKNDTIFVRMRSVTLETQKCRKRHLASTNVTFLRIVIDKNGFRRMKYEGQIYKTVPQVFILFAPGLSYDLSKFSNAFTPFFEFERP